MTAKLEKIERTLLSPAFNFNIQHVVLVGNKKYDGTYQSTLWDKDYNSNKYSNVSNLSAVNINSSDFIEFRYSDFKNKVYGSVMFSYPHMEDLLIRMKLLNELMQGEDTFFESEGELYLNNEYIDVVMTVENVVGGKTLMMYPDVIYGRNDEQIAGVIIILGSEDIAVQVSFESFNTMVNLLDGYRLNENSVSLINTALMYRILEGGIVSNNTSQTTTTEPQINRSVNNINRPSKINTDRPKIKRSKPSINNNPVNYKKPDDPIVDRDMDAVIDSKPIDLDDIFKPKSKEEIDTGVNDIFDVKNEPIDSFPFDVNDNNENILNEDDTTDELVLEEPSDKPKSKAIIDMKSLLTRTKEFQENDTTDFTEKTEGDE